MQANHKRALKIVHPMKIVVTTQSKHCDAFCGLKYKRLMEEKINLLPEIHDTETSEDL